MLTNNPAWNAVSLKELIKYTKGINKLLKVLKEEIRKFQRSEERKKHIENSEYVKNILLKVWYDDVWASQSQNAGVKVVARLHFHKFVLKEMLLRPCMNFIMNAHQHRLLPGNGLHMRQCTNSGMANFTVT